MCKAGPSLPSATDLPSSLANPEPPEMDGHLFVDIFTLCFVVVVVLLYLVLKTWQRKKAAAAAAAAPKPTTLSSTSMTQSTDCTKSSQLISNASIPSNKTG